LKDDIKTYFDLGLKRDDSNTANGKLIMKKITVELKKRKYYMSYEYDCISNKTKWQSVKAIGRIDVIRIENDKKKVTKHWNIECGLHWRLDVILDEDHSRNREGNSINNLSLIWKIVFNLARLDNSMGEKLTLKQKMTRYTSNFQNIENLIFNVISYSGI